MPLGYTFWQDRAEIDRRRDAPVFKPKTGLPPEVLTETALRMAADESKSRQRRKAEILAYILDNAQLEISPLDLFPDRINCGGVMEAVSSSWWGIYEEKSGDILAATADGDPCGAYTGGADFGHTCPDYVSLLTLGIPGILARLEKALQGASPETREFYENSILAYQAFQRMLLRFATACEACAHPTALQSAENLRAIAAHPPQNLMQALTLIAVYYRTQHHAENTVTRTLGRLDVLLEPYYIPGEETDEVLRYFLSRMNDCFMYANIPFTLGGEDISGNARCEQLALNILRIHETLDNPSPKIQLRVGAHTPRSILKKACEMIRNGSNAIVFCNDEVITRGLMKLGHTQADADNYVLIGCYEPSTMGCELACTCAGYVILPKAVECALNGGRDMLTGKLIGLTCAASFVDFDAFYAEVLRQAAHFCEQSMRRIRAYEPYMALTGASPLLSGSMACCMESGRDVYEGGTKYNDSSINLFGIATATDSLLAVKKLVYDENRVTFEEMAGILRSNWKNQEPLRLLAQTKAPKYGCGNPEADRLAADLMARTTSVINGKPNARGGKFRCGGFSINLRFTYGERCAASADGRFALASLSKNMSASDGIGANGVTSMIRSACTIDYTDLPNGTALDLVLHSSAVCGDDGLNAMLGLVDAFMQLKGFALQINVLDPSVLQKAQREPDKYKNLQVRLCGWNVRFVDLEKQEQDEFIRWSSQS